jgi:hypothetical protein
MVPSTTHATTMPSTDNNNTNIEPTTTTNEREISNSSIKHGSLRSKKLTRLRSFFFKSLRAQQQQPALSNQISRT